MARFRWRYGGQRGRAGSLGACSALLLSSFATRTSAYEARVDLHSSLQLYGVRSPYGPQGLSRQRLTHTLGLDVFGIGDGATRGGPWFVVRARMRLDGDYGIRDAEVDPAASQDYVPGLVVAPLDLSYGYLEGGGLLRGTTGFKLGRQLTYDSLGWWSFDGVRVGFAPGRLLELAGFAGWEQRGGLPLVSTSRYESDGVYRGDRTGLDPRFWGGYLESRRPAAAYGGSLELLAIEELRWRVDYRRVTQHDQVVTVPFADGQSGLQTYSAQRVSSERVGTSVSVTPNAKYSAELGAVYDLYVARVTEARGNLRANWTRELSSELGSHYRLPVFDADSIFNWFGAGGTELLRTSLLWNASRRVTLGATAGVRWLGLGSVVNGGSPSATGRDELLSLDSHFRFGRDHLSLSQLVERGDAGQRLVMDLVHRRRYPGELLETLGILSVARVKDPSSLLPERTSFVTVVGARFFPDRSPRFGVEGELAFLEGLGQRSRLLGTLEGNWP